MLSSYAFYVPKTLQLLISIYVSIMYAVIRYITGIFLKIYHMTYYLSM